VLLDQDYNVKLSDFGFSIKVSSPTAKISTNCGSYAYAAPEILAAKPYIGSQTDIWSMYVIELIIILFVTVLVGIITVATVVMVVLHELVRMRCLRKFWWQKPYIDFLTNIWSM
jgi:serine/threonine protein kinase